MTLYSTIVVAVLVLVQCNLESRAHDLQIDRVANVASYSLASHSSLSVADSKIACAAECLAKQDSDGCAAFQWDAETGSCRMQEKLNVTASAGDAVWIVLTTLPRDCAEILSADPNSRSGIYFISSGMPVWCNMDTSMGIIIDAWD